MLLSAIEQGQREYIWRGYILANDLTFWIGQEKAGKGLLWTQVCACLTRGWPMPPSDPQDPTIDWNTVLPPSYVITISLEDETDIDLKPRMVAAGADEDLVDDMSHVKRANASGGTITSRFKIDVDLPLLSDRIDELNKMGVEDGTGAVVRLIVIDPIMAASAGSVSFNQKARANIVEPLQELAREKGVGILLIGHFFRGLGSALNPNSSVTIADKVGASKGILDACRLNCVLLKDPQNPSIRRLMVLSANGGSTDEVIEFVVVANGMADPDCHLRFRMPPPQVGDEAAKLRLQAVVLRMLTDANQDLDPRAMATYLGMSYKVVNQVLNWSRIAGKAEKTRLGWRAVPAIEPPRQPVDAV
jgi:hypothetical protein